MADLGTGATVDFDTMGETWCGEITSITFQPMTREAVNTSHLGTSTWHTFIPSDLTDPGGITIEFAYDGVATAALGESTHPINNAAVTVTVTFPDTSTVACSGFLTSFEISNPLEDKIMGTAEVKFSSTVTWDDQVP